VYNCELFSSARNQNKSLESATSVENNVKSLAIAPLTAALIPAAVALDQHCLGGMWTADGYQREVESPNSVMLAALDPNLHPSSLHPSSLQPSSSSLLALACLWTILDEAHITILAVHPDCQGQGLGYLMVTALMQAAWQREMEWVTLEVRVSNQAAIALYRQFDFTDVGKRKRYYQNPDEDALILWRKGLKQSEFSGQLHTWWGRAGDRLHRSGWKALSTPARTDNLSFPLDISIFS
jgi:[ribosomal protein S18]-alanine N-acetyltransferase